MEYIENVKEGINGYLCTLHWGFVAPHNQLTLTMFAMRVSLFEVNVQSSILTNIPDDVII